MDCLITPADRIFVAGHRGMADSAICRALQRAGYSNLLTASRAELDLEDGPAVQRSFAQHQPTVVVLAAAKVGGIQANNSYPADFLLDNLKIETNVNYVNEVSKKLPDLENELRCMRATIAEEEKKTQQKPRSPPRNSPTKFSRKSPPNGPAKSPPKKV